MKKRLSGIGSLALILGLLVMTTGCPLFEDKFEATGRKLFNYYCADCHGETGMGNGYNAEFLDAIGFAPRDLTDTEEKHLVDKTNDQIFRAVSRNLKEPDEDDPTIVPLMPTFKYTLSEAEIWSIVAYVRTLHPNEASKITLTREMKRKRPRLDRIRNVDIDPDKLTDDEHIENGKELYEFPYGCNTCHSIDGEGGRIGPALDRAGFMSNADWLYRWIKNPQAIAPHSKMPALGLTDEDALDVVAYLKTLKAPAAAGGDRSPH